MSALARTPSLRAAAPPRCAVRAAADPDSRINKTIDLGSPKVCVCVWFLFLCVCMRAWEDTHGWWW